MGFTHLIFRTEHKVSGTLSVSLARLKECTELFPRRGYCHTVMLSHAADFWNGDGGGAFSDKRCGETGDENWSE
jgi:hypothetical protein